ncbi:MAG TPA: DUF6600 domain-containing protein [Candidatus Acidoferrum sp.]|nr:DUF6600 domain-containing protein [Candidatus Acidoferrum sp.]
MRPSLRTRLAAAALAGAAMLATLAAPALLPGERGGAAHADTVVEINVFERALSPYGRWFDSPRYGRVWYPTGMRHGWRPYYDDGHWVYSYEYGWMWVSDAPWGWAPFHYGRWVFDPIYGWMWVPGRVWGPAWVMFRWSDDCVGWAPLPPYAAWDPRHGYRRGGGIDVDIGFWSFVRPQGFTARRFDRYAFDRRDYPAIIKRTTNVTNITVINNRIVNNSIRVQDVERVTHQRVERLRATEDSRPEAAAIKGDKVFVYKPTVIEHGTAGTNANRGLNPALIKEDPEQDNKKRVARSFQQLQPKPEGQQQPKLKPQQDQQLKLKQQQDQQLKLKQQQQEQQLKLKQQQNQQLKLKQQQNQQLKLKQQQEQQQLKLKQQQEQGQPGHQKSNCGGPGQPPCQ